MYWRKTLYCLYCLVCICFNVPFLFAKTVLPSKAPIQFSAQTVHWSGNKNTVTLTGQVVVTQHNRNSVPPNNLDIRANKLSIYLDNHKSLSKIVANGQVVFRKTKYNTKMPNSIVATANQMIYLPKTNTLELYGESAKKPAKVWRNKSFIQGERFTVNTKTQDSMIGNTSDNTDDHGEDNDKNKMSGVSGIIYGNN
jgi:lipopolysaccharide transport protein LptA